MLFLGLLFPRLAIFRNKLILQDYYCSSKPSVILFLDLHSGLAVPFSVPQSQDRAGGAVWQPQQKYGLMLLKSNSLWLLATSFSCQL